MFFLVFFLQQGRCGSSSSGCAETVRKVMFFFSGFTIKGQLAKHACLPSRDIHQLVAVFGDKEIVIRFHVCIF